MNLQSDPSRPTVLLVDDEKTIRNLLYTLLESEGYEVLAACSGREALSIFRQALPPVDLLVTDLEMPEMTGLELARECTRLCRGLSVLYISGAQPDQHLRADLRAHRRAFLPKPFRGDDLLRKARELLLSQPEIEIALNS